MWKLCGEEFAAKARDSGYTNDLSPPCRHGVRFSPLSVHLSTILYRLRCDVWRTIFVRKLCLCAQTISPYRDSVLHWRVTLNLVLIIFHRLICRRISPVCVVSVTTRAGDWRWTQPN